MSVAVTDASPQFLDAAALSRRIHRREVSCREVMVSYLDHIDRVNPMVNAIVSLRPRDQLISEADHCDEQLARGQSSGWMHGFPHAVKDLARTAGLRTTFGSPLFADHVPSDDAIIVERMRASGAIIIGKTNTSEWGLGSQTYNPVFGTTLNPYDLTRTAGGSSGGAAAAVALRMVPVADGSDFAGSLRNPPGWTNVVGFRPSSGLVPFGPTPELFVQQFATEGPIARTVEDAALLLAVIAGFDTRCPLSMRGEASDFARPLSLDLRGRCVGWLSGLTEQIPFEQGVLDVCRSSLDAFDGLGCVVEEVTLDFPRERLWETFVMLRSWVVAGALRPLLADPVKRVGLKPEAVWEIETGSRLSGEDVFAASLARSDLYRVVNALFERFDALMLPTAQVFPFAADLHWPPSINGTQMNSYHRWMEIVALPTLCGCPTAAIPAGFGAKAQPIGLQIIGRPGDDLRVLQIAYALERTKNWAEVLPQVLVT